MQKYLALELFTEDQDDTDHTDKLVYIASEADAKIAALEKALMAIVREVEGCGPMASKDFLRLGLNSVRDIAQRAMK